MAACRAPSSGPVTRIRGSRCPSRVLQETGHLPPAGTGGPGILALGDEDRLRTLLTAAGFDDPAIDRVRFSFRFADADDYAGFLTGVAGAIAMVLDGLDHDERGRVLSQIAALPGVAGNGSR